MTIIEAARRYIELGWYPIPLRFGAKELRDKDGLSRIYAASDFQDTDNIGLQLVSARDTKRPNKIVAVDFDASEITPNVVWTFLPATCGWGRESKPLSQILYRCAVDKSHYLKDENDGSMLLEVRASHQSMCPPSTHPNGEQVRWIKDDLTVNELEWKTLQRCVNLVATYALMSRYYRDRGARHYWGLYLAGFLQKLGLTQEEAFKLFELAGEFRGDREVKDRLDAVRTTYARPDDDPTAGSNALAEEMGDDGKAFIKSLQKIWGATALGFDTNEQGRVISSSLKNVQIAIRRLELELSHDTFKDRLMMTRGGRTAPLDDATLINAWLEIEKRWGFRPQKDFFIDVISNEARLRTFHPVRDYLASLQWDQRPRLDEWLIAFGKATDSPYVRAISALVLVAAVRRVRQPGCKFDELLVLESPQGQNKSTALRALCPRDEWFGEDLPLGLDAKQMIERTNGRWIIEIAELVGSRKDAEHLKASLSRQVDGPVRLAYARMPIEQPRQFILIGTTNPASYLRDMTGNRRFWPVTVGLFDVEAIRAARDQLWAEAAHREARGDSIRLDPALWNAATSEQEKRRESDPWEDTLEELVTTCPFGTKRDGRTVRQVKTKVIYDRLGLSIERRDHGHAIRISAIMRRLGFTNTKFRLETELFSGWERSEKPPKDLISG